MSHRHFLPFQQKPVSSNLPFLPSYHIHLYHLSLAFKYHEDLEFKTRTGNYFDIVTSSWDQAGISHPRGFSARWTKTVPPPSISDDFMDVQPRLPARTHAAGAETGLGAEPRAVPCPSGQSLEISGRSPSPGSPKAGDVTGDLQLRCTARTRLLCTNACKIKRRFEKRRSETQHSACVPATSGERR